MQSMRDPSFLPKRVAANAPVAILDRAMVLKPMGKRGPGDLQGDASKWSYSDFGHRISCLRKKPSRRPIALRNFDKVALSATLGTKFRVSRPRGSFTLIRTLPGQPSFLRKALSQRQTCSEVHVSRWLKRSSRLPVRSGG